MLDVEYTSELVPLGWKDGARGGEHHHDHSRAGRMIECITIACPSIIWSLDAINSMKRALEFDNRRRRGRRIRTMNRLQA